MKLLLDTHTFLWFLDDSPQLSHTGKDLLEADNTLLLSIASLWEIAITIRLGKLDRGDAARDAHDPTAHAQ